MTSSLATFFVLFVAATEQPVAPPPAQDRIIEIIITGPEGDRGKMEETVRALVGNDPDVRWTTRASSPADGPPSAAPPERGERIWIDVAHPVQIRVDLPGCTSSGARNIRTVDRPESDEAGLVERETVAQIVKAAVQSLRGDRMTASPACNVDRARENVALAAAAAAWAAAAPLPAPAVALAAAPAAAVAPAVGLPRRRAGAVWLGMGSGLGWGYVPAGKLEWETRVEVSAQTERAGLFHLLPEVGYMWSDDFALAVQARLEFIRQQQATYRDPGTGELVRVSDYMTGTPSSMAHAGFLRAIWYHDLSSSGKLRLSLSGDVGGGVVRFPIAPVAAFNFTTSGDIQIDPQRTIARTDTRPMGMVLFGGSVGLLWHLTRHLAIALDGRALSGLPESGVVFEGQVSAQVALGSVRPRR